MTVDDKDRLLILPEVGQVRRWHSGSIFLVIESLAWSHPSCPLFSIRYNNGSCLIYSDVILTEESDVICGV